MATPVITAATSSLGSSGMGSIMTVLIDGYLRAKRNKGRILRYCNTKASEIDVAHGTARMLIAPCNMTVNSITDGTSPVPAYDATVGTYQDVQLSNHVYCAFGYAEIANCLDKGRSLDALMEGRTTSMFNTIEKTVATLASTFSTNVVGAAGTPVTEASYDELRAMIVNAQVPDGEALHGFLAPGVNAWVSLSNLPHFREWRMTGVTAPDKLPNYGTDVSGGTWFKSAYNHESQNVSEISGSPSNAYNFMFHQDSLLVAMVDMALPMSKSVEAANVYDPDSGISFQVKRYWDFTADADVVKIDSLFGCAKGRDEWGGLCLT